MKATIYIQKPTQEERILALLQARGEQGAHVWEFMLPRSQGGLGIAQYNARIYGLREKGYNIQNVTPGHFVLRGVPFKIKFQRDGQGAFI